MAADTNLSQLYTIAADNNGSIYTVGYTNDSNAQLYYAKLNTDGTLNYSKLIGVDNGAGTYIYYNDGHRSLIISSFSSLYITGYTYPSNDSSADFFVADLPTDNTITDNQYGRWVVSTPDTLITSYADFTLEDSGFGLSASDITTNQNSRNIISVGVVGQETTYFTGGLFSVEVDGKLNMNNLYSLPASRGQAGQTLIMPNIGETLVWSNAVRGDVGNDGANTARWEYKNNKAPEDPDKNYFETDNSTLNLVTVLSISKTDGYGNTFDGYFELMSNLLSSTALFLQITELDNPQIIGQFTISGPSSFVDNAGWVDLTVQWYAGSAANLTIGVLYSIGFVSNSSINIPPTLEYIITSTATASVGNDLISVGEVITVGPYNATTMGIKGPSQSVFFAYNDTVDLVALAFNDITSGGGVFLTLSPTMSGSVNSQYLQDASGIIDLVPIEYTPSSTIDAFGILGQTTYDSSFFYIKTAAGWKRSALSIF